MIVTLSRIITVWQRWGQDSARAWRVLGWRSPCPTSWTIHSRLIDLCQALFLPLTQRWLGSVHESKTHGSAVLKRLHGGLELSAASVFLLTRVLGITASMPLDYRNAIASALVMGSGSSCSEISEWPVFLSLYSRTDTLPEAKRYVSLPLRTEVPAIVTASTFLTLLCCLVHHCTLLQHGHYSTAALAVNRKFKLRRTKIPLVHRTPHLRKLQHQLHRPAVRRSD